MSEEHNERTPLSTTIRILGDMLGGVIVVQEGAAALAVEERVRRLAKELRARPSESLANEMAALIGDLSLQQLKGLVKAFTHYFGMVNLAESVERLRVLRQRAHRKPDQLRSESIAAAIHDLHQAGVSAEQLQALLHEMRVMPVFTAHPTEAKRRTTLKKLHAIANAVATIQAEDSTDEERDELRDVLAHELCKPLADAGVPYRAVLVDGTPAQGHQARRRHGGRRARRDRTAWPRRVRRGGPRRHEPHACAPRRAAPRHRAVTAGR